MILQLLQSRVVALEAPLLTGGRVRELSAAPATTAAPAPACAPRRCSDQARGVMVRTEQAGWPPAGSSAASCPGGERGRAGARRLRAHRRVHRLVGPLLHLLLADGRRYPVRARRSRKGVWLGVISRGGGDVVFAVLAWIAVVSIVAVTIGREARRLDAVAPASSTSRTRRSASVVERLPAATQARLTPGELKSSCRSAPAPAPRAGPAARRRDRSAPGHRRACRRRRGRPRRLPARARPSATGGSRRRRRRGERRRRGPRLLRRVGAVGPAAADPDATSPTPRLRSPEPLLAQGCDECHAQAVARISSRPRLGLPPEYLVAPAAGSAYTATGSPVRCLTISWGPTSPGARSSITSSTELPTPVPTSGLRWPHRAPGDRGPGHERLPGRPRGCSRGCRCRRLSEACRRDLHRLALGRARPSSPPAPGSASASSPPRSARSEPAPAALK